MHPHALAAKKSKRHNRVRIIGGRWRGRRITFPDIGGLRPTPDRVRETLFNWLQPWLPGATCLDLFAGSGVLGFEALSRGAERMVFVEQNPQAAAALRTNLRALDVDSAEVVCGNGLEYLHHRPQPFDILFIDPPFSRGYLERYLPLVEAGPWVRPGGLVYMEAERTLQPLPIPENWELIRSKTAGRVGYHLARTAPA